MRHPSSDKRAAQFMFASPRRAKHVRTSSCAKALARMSYTRGLASFFIVATPASNSLLNRLCSAPEFMYRRAALVQQMRLPVIGLLVTRDRPLSVGQLQAGEHQARDASRHTFAGSGGAAIVPPNVHGEGRAACGASLSIVGLGAWNTKEARISKAISVSASNAPLGAEKCTYNSQGCAEKKPAHVVLSSRRPLYVKPTSTPTSRFVIARRRASEKITLGKSRQDQPGSFRACTSVIRYALRCSSDLRSLGASL